MANQITPSVLKNKLELAQAKEWGYKSIKAASKDGYNVTRTNCDVREMKRVLSLSENEAMNLVYSWKSDGLIKFISYNELNQIVFI